MTWGSRWCYGEALRAHPLRREIVTTAVANDLVNRGGITFVQRAAEETALAAATVARAAATAAADAAAAAADAAMALELQVADTAAAVQAVAAATARQVAVDTIRAAELVLANER